MKKIICILMSVLMIMTTMCLFATAESVSDNTYTFETEDAVYTVEFHDNNLTPEEQEIVAAKLVGIGDDSIQPYGLGCTLFGHDYKYTTSTVLTHKARASAPRCKKQIYDVKYCADCDYKEETLADTTYIYCCLED